MTSNIARQSYIDIVKGIAIWCIVLLHYEDGYLSDNVCTYIGSFMIIMFYITSGWISGLRQNDISTKELFFKRLRQLGWPYLVWSGIILSFDVVLFVCGYYDLRFVGAEVLKTISLRGVGTLWFLPAIFFGELLWNWIKKKGWQMIILAVLLSLLYMLFYDNVFRYKEGDMWRIADLPFRTVCNATRAWIPIMIGSLLCRPMLNMFVHQTKILTFCVGMILCLASYLMMLYLHTNQYNVSIVYLIFGVGTCMGLISVAYSSCHFKGVVSFFEYWGRNSLSLMITHYSIVMVLLMIFNEYVIGIPSSPKFIGKISLLYFFISIPIQYLITELINKKMKFLLYKYVRRQI